MSDRNLPSETEVILVHGTFAPNAPWTMPTSKLSLKMMAALSPCEIVRFPWTGGNSHGSRIEAGEQLAQFICDRAARFRERRRVIIAHSHGGNVVLYALRNQSCALSISNCVFMGTPFIRCRGRDVRRAARALAIILFRIFPILMLIGIFAPALGTSLGLVGVAVLGIGFAWWALDGSLRMTASFVAFTGKLKAAALARHQTALLSVPSLICVTKRDEASRYLKANSFLSSIPLAAVRMAWAIYGRRDHVFILFSVGMALGVFAEAIGMTALGAQVMIVSGVVLGLWIVSLFAFLFGQLAGLLVPAMVRWHPLGFGYEGVFTHPLVQIWTSPSPDVVAGTELCVCPFAFSRTGLLMIHHSQYYDDDCCLQTMADWLNGVRLGTCTAPAASSEQHAT